MCFMWISGRTAIISLYSINWLVSITEMKCVYCAVRTGSLNKIEYLSFWKPIRWLSMLSFGPPANASFLPKINNLLHDFHAAFSKISLKNFSLNIALQTQSKLYQNIILQTQESTQNAQNSFLCNKPQTVLSHIISQRFIFSSAYLYEKDEQTLPGNLPSNKLALCLPIMKINSVPHCTTPC